MVSICSGEEDAVSPPARTRADARRSGCRLHVVVESEQIARIVLRLDLLEPPERLLRQ